MSLKPARGPGQLKPLAGATGSAARFLGESQAGLCEKPGACLDWDLNRRNFSKRKREKRGTQWLFGEFSAAAVASCAPTPSAPGL